VVNTEEIEIERNLFWWFTHRSYKLVDIVSALEMSKAERFVRGEKSKI